MSSFTRGRQAEARAAAFLEEQGYAIKSQNWRTRRCEIDIIAEKDTVTYFVEVKYRSSPKQGTGMEYVTPAKLRQMRYAAETWISENEWKGECSLSVISIDGEQITFIDQLDL